MIPRPGPNGASYRRWDGSQDFDLGANEIFAELAESLLYHGDPSAALRDLMARGMKRPDGEDVLGLREILERLKQRRDELLKRYDPSGKTREIDQALREILASERGGLEDFLNNANKSNDGDRIRSAEELYLDHQLTLDAMGPSVQQRFSSLMGYEFVSPKAKSDFDALTQSLRDEFTQGFFNAAKNSLSSMSVAQLAQQREMLAELNSLIANHQSGSDTTQEFSNFMSKYGEMFAEGISNTDELIAYLVAQMAAASLAFGALSAGQQAELSELAASVFSDLDMSWQMSQLMNSLSSMLGQNSLARAGFQGQNSMTISEASGALGHLGELDSIESFLRAVSSPNDLSHLDLDQVASELGEQEARSLARLAEVAHQLEEAGLISTSENRLSLSAAGVRRIGSQMLGDVFENLVRSRLGAHQWHRRGVGIDKDFETKVYEFGDPLNLSIGNTLKNTIVRQRGGVPLLPKVDDFEIETTESLVSTSTVLCLDLSLSMPLRDNFLSAKKVAVALHSLISSRFPRDFLAIVGFSELAHEIKARDLPSVSWDYVYGTNMADALRQSRQLLSQRSGKRQILMITDGEPTAHVLPNGEPFFSYPPVQETITATLNEVRRCTKSDIVINSFVLDASDYLRDFMNKVARINRGRVFYTDPGDLGKYVLVDFLQSKRS